MNGKLFLLLGTFLALFLPVCLSAARDTLACYQELERNFFDEQIVIQALSLNKVYQSQWRQITRQLKRQESSVPQMVKEKAQLLTRDPFRRPFQVDVAIQILLQVEQEIFSMVLFEYGVTSPGKIQSMFTYIRDQNMQRMPECFGTTTE